MPLRKVVVGEFYPRTEPSLQPCGMSEVALTILPWTCFVYEIPVPPP